MRVLSLYRISRSKISTLGRLLLYSAQSVMVLSR